MFNLFKPKAPPLDWRLLEIEATGSKDFGPCDCCGNMSRTVWGFVHSPVAPLAAYFVQWTLGNPGHGANFDLIIGKWGQGATSQDRQAVSLAYRLVEAQGSFMIIDAATRPVDDPSTVGRALRRDEVVGKPIAPSIFAMVDAIYMKDERIQEIHGWSKG